MSPNEKLEEFLKKCGLLEQRKERTIEKIQDLAENEEKERRVKEEKKRAKKKKENRNRHIKVMKKNCN